MTVAVGFGGKLQMSQAVEVLGVSNSTVCNLIKAKKIKAQKIDGQWILEANDVYRMKGSVKGRIHKARTIEVKAQTLPIASLQYQYDKNKLDVLNMVCQLNGISLANFVIQQLDGLYDKTSKLLKLSDINKILITQGETHVDRTSTTSSANG